MSSRIPSGDKSIKRLPSRASERELEESNPWAGSAGGEGIEKRTTVTSVRTPPLLEASGDEVELVEPRLPSSQRRNPWEVC